MPLVSPQLAGSPRLQKAVKNAPPIGYGESNEGVAAMQRGFVELGYPMPISTGNGSKPADGIYGKETGEILKRFQRDQGLAADGLAGTNTLTRLDELLVTLNSYSAVLENAAIAAQMAGPNGQRPFAATSARRS
jgi:peptidoglycan hydrolase-like protein with peptidoglycan-binding domain